MGSRLLIGAAFGAALATVPAHAQPGPLPAADSAKQGTDLYKAGDYARAVAPLQRAVEMEPNNFEYRFMLAQALRQSGNCGAAVPHYKQLESSVPPERAEELKTAAAGCPSADVNSQPATPVPAPPQPPAEPTVVYKSSGVSGVNALLLAGAGAGVATGLCLFIAASSDDDDAAAAASYDDYSRISTRADRLRIGAAVAAGAGIALGVIGMYRLRGSNEGTQVSLTPRKGGGMFVLERSW